MKNRFKKRTYCDVPLLWDENEVAPMLRIDGVTPLYLTHDMQVTVTLRCDYVRSTARLKVEVQNLKEGK